MGSRTVSLVLASLALLVAPLAAQDTTSVPKDTTGAIPKPDTTGARKDTVVVVQPVLDTTRRDTTAAAVPAAAADNSVRPGMTENDVKTRWGPPIAVRSINDWTYLFYRNNEERYIGYYDVVMLQHGQVMDAIVRSPDHVYGGVSSSPPDRAPAFTPPRGQPADSAKGAAVTGVQVKPGQ